MDLPRVLHTLTWLVLLGMAGCSVPAGDNQRAALSQEIERDLPLGSTLDQVEAYLQTKQLGYTYVERENRVYALVADVQRTGIVTKSLQIILTMDELRRLQRVEVKSVYTGP